MRSRGKIDVESLRGMLHVDEESKKRSREVKAWLSDIDAKKKKSLGLLKTSRDNENKILEADTPIMASEMSARFQKIGADCREDIGKIEKFLDTRREVGQGSDFNHDDFLKTQYRISLMILRFMLGSAVRQSRMKELISSFMEKFITASFLDDESITSRQIDEKMRQDQATCEFYDLMTVISYDNLASEFGVRLGLLQLLLEYYQQLVNYLDSHIINEQNKKPVQEILDNYLTATESVMTRLALSRDDTLSLNARNELRDATFRNNELANFYEKMRQPLDDVSQAMSGLYHFLSTTAEDKITTEALKEKSAPVDLASKKLRTFYEEHRETKTIDDLFICAEAMNHEVVTRIHDDLEVLPFEPRDDEILADLLKDYTELRVSEPELYASILQENWDFYPKLISLAEATRRLSYLEQKHASGELTIEWHPTDDTAGDEDFTNEAAGDPNATTGDEANDSVFANTASSDDLNDDEEATNGATITSDENVSNEDLSTANDGVDVNDDTLAEESGVNIQAATASEDTVVSDEDEDLATETNTLPEANNDFLQIASVDEDDDTDEIIQIQDLAEINLANLPLTDEQLAVELGTSSAAPKVSAKKLKKAELAADASPEAEMKTLKAKSYLEAYLDELNNIFQAQSEVNKLVRQQIDAHSIKLKTTTPATQILLRFEAINDNTQKTISLLLEKHYNDLITYIYQEILPDLASEKKIIVYATEKHLIQLVRKYLPLVMVPSLKPLLDDEGKILDLLKKYSEDILTNEEARSKMSEDDRAEIISLTKNYKQGIKLINLWYQKYHIDDIYRAEDFEVRDFSYNKKQLYQAINYYLLTYKTHRESKRIKRYLEEIHAILKDLGTEKTEVQSDAELREALLSSMKTYGAMLILVGKFFLILDQRKLRVQKDLKKGQEFTISLMTMTNGELKLTKPTLLNIARNYIKFQNEWNRLMECLNKNNPSSGDELEKLVTKANEFIDIVEQANSDIMINFEMATRDVDITLSKLVMTLVEVMKKSPLQKV